MSPYPTTIQLVVFDTNFTVRASAGLYQFEPDCEPVSKSTRKTSKSFPPIAMLSFATTRDLRVSLPDADKPCACQLNLCSCESPTHIGNLNMLRLGEYAIVTFGLEVAGPENSPHSRVVLSVPLSAFIPARLSLRRVMRVSKTSVTVERTLMPVLSTTTHAPGLTAGSAAQSRPCSAPVAAVWAIEITDWNSREKTQSH